MSEYLNNAKDTIEQNAPSSESITNGISGAAEQIRTATQSATDSFSSKSAVDAGNEFLAANGMIAKFVFVILVLIVFMFFLNLGVGLVTYLVTPSTSPYIIHGMLSGNETQSFPQTPGNGNPVVYRSNNQNGGIEFTWSMWLNIRSVPADFDGSNPKNPKAKTVFVKGNDNFTSSTVPINDVNYSEIANVNNGPGVYLVPYTENSDGNGTNRSASTNNQVGLLYVMDVVSPTYGNGEISSVRPFAAIIPNLPLGKWVHVAIRLQNKVLDCYVNGVITKRISFGDQVPKQNYENIVYAGNSGFPGAISNLRYHDHALSVFEINSIVYYGPNLKSASTASSSFFDYLGQPWYSSGTNQALIRQTV